MSYTASSVEIKKDVEHVRIRPRMYLGNFAKTKALLEILDNGVDEFVRGYGSEVRFIVHEDGSYEVHDDGRGMPVDFDKSIDANGVVKCLTFLNSGSNFSNAGKTAGTNGVGATACNAISDRMDVTVFRDGKKYVQQFRRGVPGTFKGNEFDPTAEFSPEEGKKLTGVKAAKNDPKHGTHIRFIFDKTILVDDTVDLDEVFERLNFTARLNDGLKVYITNQGEELGYQGPKYGVTEVLHFGADEQALLSLSGDIRYQVVSTTVDSKGNETTGKETKTAGFDVALTTSNNQKILSFVNTVHTLEGGTHETTVLKALGTAATQKRVRNLKLNNGEDYPKPEDFAAVVSFAVNISMPEPPFVGQDKRKIKTPAVFNNAFSRELERQLTAWVVSPANADAVSKWAELALEHSRTQRKVEAAKASSKAGSKSHKLSGNLALPDKFLPSTFTGVGSGAECHFCEGDSAAGSVEAARDGRYQACYPLRGKQINSFETPLGPPVKAELACNPRRKGEPITMRSNETFVAIERILGCGARDNCVPENCRFDRIIFTTDADPDGANIAAQLTCMFYFNFRPLLDAGMVYIAVPPLFVIDSKVSNDRFYAINEDERDEVVLMLTERDGKRPFVKRCKGLGEMNEDEFFDTVMDPRRRVLRKLVVDDDTYDNLRMAFGPDPEERRKFLAEMDEIGASAEVEVF